jgi:glycerate kinase
LIRHAVAAGAGAVLLGVGGSATHDLGLGALAALGLTFAGRDERVIPNPIPATWPQLTRIAGRLPAGLPPVRIACDVANPLLGANGAAAVYAPQKGLQPADLPKLEAASQRLATMLCTHLQQPPELMVQPGAGAAGGIAFGLMAAAGAMLLPGSELVSAWLDLDRHVTAAELIITGEGTFDDSSLSGKGPGSLASQGLARGKPVHVFAGRVSLSQPAAARLHLHAITPAGMPLREALAAAPHLLAATVRATF